MYNSDMDRKSKILLYIFFFLFMGTVMFAYARYMIFYDFEVIVSEAEEDTLVEEVENTEDVVLNPDGNAENPSEEIIETPSAELPQ